MQPAELTTMRACLSEGRQGVLVDGKRRVVVRVFDESPHGFRVATIQATALAPAVETALHVDGREFSVRVIDKHQAGRRLVLSLERLER
jgi:Lon protease-like protein